VTVSYAIARRRNKFWRRCLGAGRSQTFLACRAETSARCTWPSKRPRDLRGLRIFIGSTSVAGFGGMVAFLLAGPAAGPVSRDDGAAVRTAPLGSPGEAPRGWASTSAKVARRRCGRCRGGGSARAGANGQGRVVPRSAADSPARRRYQRADTPAARRCRAHHRTPTAGRQRRLRPRSVRQTQGPRRRRASRSMCWAPSRSASARARVVLPLPAQPTTTTRSGIGWVGAGRAAISVRYGADGQPATASRTRGYPQKVSTRCPVVINLSEPRQIHDSRLRGMPLFLPRTDRSH
jgi:hypothetical protein